MGWCVHHLTSWGTEYYADIGPERVWYKDRTCLNCGKIVERKITRRERGGSN